MENLLFQYLLPCSCSLILLYAVYRIALRNSPFFQHNRLYLLCCISFSLALPFIKLYYPVSAIQPLTYATLIESMQMEEIQEIALNESVANSFNFAGWCFYIYIIGVIFFTSRMLFSIARIFFLRIKYGMVKNKGHKIVYMHNKLSHFSFFSLIFINRNNIQENEEEVVLQHECTHVRQGHSWDLLLLEVMIILQWFNPVVWAYKQAIRMTHEYYADKTVVVAYTDKGEYMKLLFNQLAGFSFDGLISNFKYSPIKKRITMLMQKNTPHYRKTRVLWALPVVVVLLLFFSCKAAKEKDETSATPSNEAAIVNETPITNETSAQPAPQAQEKETVPADIVQYKEAVPVPIAIVQIKPRFQNGDEGVFSQWVRDNFRYPEDAREKGIQGRVYAQFIVNSKGKLEKIEIMRGLDESIDKEIIRVLKASPEWEPGKHEGKAVDVKYTLPIALQLRK